MCKENRALTGVTLFTCCIYSASSHDGDSLAPKHAQAADFERERRDEASGKTMYRCKCSLIALVTQPDHTSTVKTRA
jgi:hypothetical protein